MAFRVPFKSKHPEIPKGSLSKGLSLAGDSRDSGDSSDSAPAQPPAQVFHKTLHLSEPWKSHFRHRGGSGCCPALGTSLTPSVQLLGSQLSKGDKFFPIR